MVVAVCLTAHVGGWMPWGYRGVRLTMDKTIPMGDTGGSGLPEKGGLPCTGGLAVGKEEGVGLGGCGWLVRYLAGAVVERGGRDEFEAVCVDPLKFRLFNPAFVVPATLGRAHWPTDPWRFERKLAKRILDAYNQRTKRGQSPLQDGPRHCRHPFSLSETYTHPEAKND